MMVQRELAQQVFGQLDECGGPRQMSRYVAVPGNAAVRWLLPAEGKSLSPILASWTPYRVGSRMAWAAVRAATHCGHVAELPGVAVVDVEQPQRADWRSLGWVWDGTPIPVVYVGTPGPRRKAVVHLVEAETGLCRAVVKVPLAEGAKTALLHEADVLEALEEERCESAPRLLHVNRTRGVVTQTFVDGRPGLRKLEAEHWRLLLSLLLPDETTSLRAHAERWSRQIDDSSAPECVKAALDELHDNAPIPACWEHGDFTPWNLRRMTNGRFVLLDWEEARRGGLPLCDAFHFLHMQGFLFGRKPQLHLAHVSKTAKPRSLSARQINKLEMAYLVGAYLTCIQRKNEARARFIVATLAKFGSEAA